MPKKKFTFARARKEKKEKAPAKTETKEEHGTSDQFTHSELKGNHLQIKDINNDQNVIKTASDYEGKENVIIENVTDS